MTVFVTHACNFRCAYCNQEHITKRLDAFVADNIIKLIDIKSKSAKNIQINWFGGEPLLEYDTIQKLMSNAKSICEQNQCVLTASITTNAYLFDRKKIAQLKELGLRAAQITIDGGSKSHNAKRKLMDGRGTYEQVLTNLVECLEQGIFVTLRINVDEKNIDDIDILLNTIPVNLRHLVMINIVNVFQNKEKMSTFEQKKRTIDKGYPYYERNNFSGGCISCLKNSVVIDTDGAVLLCTNTEAGEKRIGYLDSDGNIRIEEKSKLYRLKIVSALDNPKCRECIELPYCLSGCGYARIKKNDVCIGKRPDGMSASEYALLDYYYNRKKAQLRLL